MLDNHHWLSCCRSYQLIRSSNSCRMQWIQNSQHQGSKDPDFVNLWLKSGAGTLKVGLFGYNCWFSAHVLVLWWSPCWCYLSASQLVSLSNLETNLANIEITQQSYTIIINWLNHHLLMIKIVKYRSPGQVETRRRSWCVSKGRSWTMRRPSYRVLSHGGSPFVTIGFNTNMVYFDDLGVPPLKSLMVK